MCILVTNPLSAFNGDPLVHSIPCCLMLWHSVAIQVSWL